MSIYHPRPQRQVHTGDDIIIQADNFETGNTELPTRYRTMFRFPPKSTIGMTSLGNIKFQHGPVGIEGRNGLSEEALIAILIDRLEAHQEGQHPSDENDEAIANLRLAWSHLRGALRCLNERTADREARGVEGTDEA